MILLAFCFKDKLGVQVFWLDVLGVVGLFRESLKDSWLGSKTKEAEMDLLEFILPFLVEAAQ